MYSIAFSIEKIRKFFRGVKLGLNLKHESIILMIQFSFQWNNMDFYYGK